MTPARNFLLGAAIALGLASFAALATAQKQSGPRDRSAVPPIREPVMFDTAEADRILWPMMETYRSGGFQNGVGNGGEWRRWDGAPSGYEGFLADAYYTQMAVFTGYFGIGFGAEGYKLEPWSPLRGKTTPLGLKYMGKVIETVGP